MSELINGVLDGIVLTRKAGMHTDAHTDIELRRLLRLIRTEQLHQFRPGRIYNNETVLDDENQ
jgi:hypothetical protein